MYLGPVESEVILNMVPVNPFSEEFVCRANDCKGGVFLTENVTYGW